MPEPNVRRASHGQGFDNPETQKEFDQDNAARVNDDVDKDLSKDQTAREKMLADIAERMNSEIMDMITTNDTFINFIGNYLKAAFDWGDKNDIEFWNVGLDGSKSFYSHDGKTVMMKFCRTERNPNPMTGEKKTPGGIILPGGG